MSNRKVSLVLMTLVAQLFLMCSGEIEDHAKPDKSLKIVTRISDIQKIISDSLYPTTIVYSGSHLMFNMKTPLHEIYYENKMSILKERAVFLVRDYIKGLDTLWFSLEVPEIKKEPILVYYDSITINKIIANNLIDKMQYDYKTYIIRHLTGDKLHKFSIYLGAIKMSNPEFNVTEDYIQLLLLLIDEKYGRLKNAHVRQILITLKNLILSDKEWKDFNPEDVDYFLNYKGK